MAALLTSVDIAYRSQPLDEAPLLTSIAVLCRSHHRIFSTEGVTRLVESFVDPTPLWTVIKATGKGILENLVSSLPATEDDCKPLAGQLRLLKRISAWEDAAGIDWFLKQKQFDTALNNSVQGGHANVAKWLVEEYFPTGIVIKAVRTAVQVVNLEFLQWIHEHHNARVLWWGDALSLLPHEVIRTPNKSDIFKMVKWIHDSVVPVDPDETSSIVLTAARIGDLEMLTWILKLESIRRWRMEELVTWAAWFGHKNVLEWAVDHLGATLSQGEMNGAVSGGQLELAQWLLSKGINSLSVAAITDAVRSKHSNVIEWVFNHLILPTNDFGPMSDFTLALEGQLDIFERLDRIGVTFSPMAMDVAARSGNLHLVKWLHEHQTGCSFAAIDGAADNGHLDIIRWLHSNRSEGCTTNAMDQTATQGHLEVVQWLHEHRTEGCTVQAMNGASTNGHLAVVKWLHSHRNEGCTTDAMDGAAKSGHLDILIFLNENRDEGYSSNCMGIAARGGHLEVVKWLHLTRGEEISSGIVEEAAVSGDVDTLKWLLQHYHSKSGVQNAPMLCPLECAIILASDDHFAWEDGAITSGFNSRDVEVSCWMWSKRPEDVSVALDSARNVDLRKCEEFEKIQDTIAPGWRERGERDA